MLEKGCNTLGGARPKRQGPLARRSEALCPVAFAQAHAAQTGAKALLGMGPRGQHRFHHLGDRWPAVGRPAHEALGGPCGIVSVGRGHVVCHGTMAALLGRAQGARDPRALVKEFDDLRTQAHIELLRDQGVRDGVVMACGLHVVVDMDAGRFPLRVFIGVHRERPERRALKGRKHALPGAGQFLEGPPVEVHE
jgi:hypothetical protein